MQDTVIWPCHNTPPKKDVRQIARKYKSVYADTLIEYCATYHYDGVKDVFYLKYDWSA